jgi:hypothetical protein
MYTVVEREAAVRRQEAASQGSETVLQQLRHQEPERGGRCTNVGWLVGSVFLSFSA